MYNMKKIITLLMLTFIVSISYAQYTPMTAAGYQFKRILCDSTLHIPSFCGIPTLRNSTAKNGAIAMDTCNFKIYMWTNAAGWGEIGAGTDTTSLSNRIDQRVKYTDTAQMLLAYLRKVDTTNKWVNDVTKKNDSTITVFKGATATDITLSTGAAATPTLQEVTTQGATTSDLVELTSASALTTNLNKFETGTGYSVYYPISWSDVVFNGYGWLKSYDETPGAIYPELKANDNSSSGSRGFTFNISELSWENQGNRIKLIPYETINPTANYDLYYPDFDNTIAKDTIATLRDLRNGGGSSGTVTNVATGYGLSGGPITNTGTLTADTSDSGLSGKYLRIVDTANKWVNNIYRTSGKDSIIYYIGSTRYAIKDSVGGGSSQNGRFGNDTATVVMVKVHNDAGVTLTNGKVVALATSGNNNEAPAVRLANNKGDSTSANTLGFVSGTIANQDTGWVILSGKIEKLNTSAYSNGDIIYLDSVSGNWTKTKPVAPYHMVYLGVVVKSNAGNGSIFVKAQNGYELDEIHDVQITSKQNNQILVYSDTQKIWKNRSIYSVVDTVNTIATKTNVAAKVNISDTATMLTPYLRSNIAAATYLAKTDTASLSSRINLKVNIADTSTMLTPYIRLAGTGLTKSSQTLSNNLSTGVSGGQSVVGGTAASNSLTLSSTTNATKGKIFLGSSSAFDEVNNRIGIGTTSPSEKFEITGTDYAFLRTSVTNTTGNNETGFNFLTYDGTSVAQNGGVTSTNSTFNYQAYGANATVLFSSKSGGLGLMSRNAAAGNIRFYTGGDASGNERMRIFNGGNVAIATTTDAGYKLDVNGTARANQFQLSALNTAPATSTSTGTTGEIRIVNGFIYVCVATNTWQRATLSTF